MKDLVLRKELGVMALLSLVFVVGSFMETDTDLEKSTFHTFLPAAFGQEMADSLANSLEKFYQTKPSQTDIQLMWLGKHKIGDLEGFASAGYLIKTSQNIVLIDSSSLLDSNIENIEQIDIIFVTHTHGDHFIPESTVKLQEKTDSIVIANPAAYGMLESDIPSGNLYKMEPDTTQEITFGESSETKIIKVQSFLAEHPVKKPLVYLFEIDGFTIFHGADSGFVESLDKISTDVHISLVPTGSPSPSASPQNAYQMVKSTNPIVAYAMHGSEKQNQEFVSLIKKDESLNTRPIIPKQYEITNPTEVVPEFPNTIIIMIAGVFVTILIARYSRYKIGHSLKLAQ